MPKHLWLQALHRLTCHTRNRQPILYPPGQTRAGGNDYHGGTSLSLFIDEGGAEDSYNNEQSANDIIQWWPEFGIFCDLQGSVWDALRDNARTALIPASDV